MRRKPPASQLGLNRPPAGLAVGCVIEKRARRRGRGRKRRRRRRRGRRRGRGRGGERKLLGRQTADTNRRESKRIEAKSQDTCSFSLTINAERRHC